MPATILEHLKFLYGEGAASSVHARLQELIARRTNQTGFHARARTELPVNERDVLLMTYGDQLHEPEKPPLKSLGEFAEKYLRGVVSGLHILPFYPYSSGEGFSVIDHLQVDPALGTWADIASLRRDFDLMFDCVFNHISAQSEWFRKFLKDDPVYREFFIVLQETVVHPHILPLLTRFQAASGEKRVWTTFGADQVDLNFRNPAVLLVLLDVLLFYVERGARFIRLDGIAYLWKQPDTPCIHLPQAHRIVQLVRSVLDRVAPEVMLVAETNVAQQQNISYVGDGANEAQLVYNLPLPPLVLHSLLTANAAKLAEWVSSLTLPSAQATFLNFLACQDGIGFDAAGVILSEAEIEALKKQTQAHGGFLSQGHNPDGSKGCGELNISFFDALSNPSDTSEPTATQVKRFTVAHAILLSLSGVPAIYFHSLFGSRGDIASAVTSGIPRRINRQKLKRARLENDLENPNSLRSRVYSSFKDLFWKRRSHPAFHPCGHQQVLMCDKRVFALARISPDGGRQALCLHNVSNQLVHAQVHWPERQSQRGDSLIPGGKLSVALPPYEAHWIMD